MILAKKFIHCMLMSGKCDLNLATRTTKSKKLQIAVTKRKKILKKQFWSCTMKTYDDVKGAELWTMRLTSELTEKKC